MFEVRCGKKEHIQFGCGHARNNAQITFYQCTLPKGHDEGESPTKCKDVPHDHILFEYVDFVEFVAEKIDLEPSGIIDQIIASRKRFYADNGRESSRFDG